MPKAQLTLPNLGGKGAQIVVDGHDITNAVRGLTLNAAVGQVHELTLDLAIYDITVHADEHTRVHIPDTTRDALLALGWTPPH